MDGAWEQLAMPTTGRHPADELASRTNSLCPLPAGKASEAIERQWVSFEI